MMLEMISALSVSAFTIMVLSQVHGFVDTRRRKRQMLEDSSGVFGDLDAIIGDVSSNGGEELYEVDLSLKSYFDDNEVRMQDLANRLHEGLPWPYPKDQTLSMSGDLLEWLMCDFYRSRREEEERIRIWSRNIRKFHEKKSGIPQTA